MELLNELEKVLVQKCQQNAIKRLNKEFLFTSEFSLDFYGRLKYGNYSLEGLGGMLTAKYEQFFCEEAETMIQGIVALIK